MQQEAVIRDYLAENLSFLEDSTGLQLVSKEYKVPNPLGSAGRIDILAKDKYGLYVIIEIKRSNQAARQALHELYKYTALFKQNLSLFSDKVRCMIVSTEWYELLVPFCEYKQEVDYHVDGYKITLGSSGLPASKQLIESIPEEKERFPFPIHKVFFFTSPNDRDSGRNNIEKQLEDFNVKNYCIFFLNYKGDDKRVIYPYLQYLALYQFSVQESIQIRERFDLLNCKSESSDETKLEEEVLSYIHHNLDARTDTEVGYPEKLGRALSIGWQLEHIYRRGHTDISSNPATDEEILKEVMGFDGGNSSQFEAITTPKFKASWNKKVKDINSFLKGNSYWRKGAKNFLKKIESSSCFTVTMRVYSACPLLLSLFYTYFSDGDYLPTLELFAHSSLTNEIEVLVGFLQWNNTTFPNVKAVFGEDPFITLIEGNLYRDADAPYNIKLLEKHGFNFNLIRFSFNENNKQCYRLTLNTEGKVIEHKINVDEDIDSFISLEKFFYRNKTYLSSLREIIQSAVYLPEYSND